MSRRNRPSRKRRARNKKRKAALLDCPRTAETRPMLVRGLKVRKGDLAEINFETSGIPLPYTEGKGLSDQAAITDHILSISDKSIN